MYKVFVDDTPIILSTTENTAENYFSSPIKEANIEQIIEKIKKGELEQVHLYHPKKEKLLHYFQQQLKPIKAGGGLVKNSAQNFLFIYRKKHWDLPKGKAEKGESIQETAVREVAEETGVQDLTIINEIPTITYHIMKWDGEYRLKITYWFEMRTSFTEALQPQTAEGITKAEWKNFKQTKFALKNTFANIKLLFPSKYFKE